MVERRTITDNLMIRYEGLFSLDELCRVIEDWQRQNGYEKHILKDFEHVTKKGKNIEIDMQPWKNINENERSAIRLIILIKNMRDVFVKVTGAKMKMNQGEVLVRISGYHLSDLAHKWEGKSYVYFIRAVINKYIYRISPEDKRDGLVAGDLNSLYHNIRAYLNLVRRRVQ